MKRWTMNWKCAHVLLLAGIAGSGFGSASALAQETSAPVVQEKALSSPSLLVTDAEGNVQEPADPADVQAAPTGRTARMRVAEVEIGTEMQSEDAVASAPETSAAPILSVASS